jgi:putative flippase GtrA
VPRSFADLVAWTKSSEGRKLIRYTLGSVYTTIFSQSVIFITYGFHLISGVIGATLFANVLATLPSYHLNRRWAWSKSGASHWRKEILPYWGIAFTGIAFSTIAAFGTKYLIHHHTSWTHLVDTCLVALVNLISFVIFWILKMLVFNRIFHIDTMGHGVAHATLEKAHGTQG